MSTITEIEAAIERLPSPELEELAAWFAQHRAARTPPQSVQAWLAQAIGAAKSGATTSEIMALTRGEK